MHVLVFNPGSNSLKFQLVEAAGGQPNACSGKAVLSATIEDFGNPATLSVLQQGEAADKRKVDVHDMVQATQAAIGWIASQSVGGRPALETLEAVAVRVVHGGPEFAGAALYTAEARARIEALEELAPLHNRNSLAIIDNVAQARPNLPIAVTFDTAFHRTLPEVAWRYPIERELADRHGIRKFGFHGVSHRYLLERYAQLHGKRPENTTVITLHLESGSSACAIQHGRSIDTTMGLTPLEGLMMGSRSGNIDPAIVEVLMRKEGIDVRAAMDILNRQSGLLGIGGHLDTRVLVRQDDERARLALQMFSYRVKQAVGAYLAVLNGAEAIVFGGGIGEDSPAIRKTVCDGLGFAGVLLDETANEQAVLGEHCISAPSSSVEVWSMPSEEGLQIVHECVDLLSAEVDA